MCHPGIRDSEYPGSRGGWGWRLLLLVPGFARYGRDDSVDRATKPVNALPPRGLRGSAGRFIVGASDLSRVFPSGPFDLQLDPILVIHT
jgi:hypothetical protein